jgi:hypothetical protein
VRTQARFDRSCVLLASPGAVPVQRGRSRIATFGRLFEGTDEISLGQTTRDGPFGCLIRHSFHERPRHLQDRPVNVAELLARRTKTVSFWQCHFTVRWRPTTTQDGRHPRAHSAHCDEPRGRPSATWNTTRRPLSVIHNLWITMWTVWHRPSGRPRGGPSRGHVSFDNRP